MLNTGRLISDIKKTGDLLPEEHDGSYILVKELVSEYAKLDDNTFVDSKDLEAIYHMCIGTWKQSVEKKKKSIDLTHLPQKSKDHMISVLDEVWNNACLRKYSNHEESSKNPTVGMFGTGFYSFHNTSEDDVRTFIKMCTSIMPLEDDEEIFEIVENVMEKGIEGVATASLSMMLHCLKPYTFPIINGNFTGETIFPLLGVKLVKPKHANTYILNCRAIKEFRDSNFGRINYRVLDLFSLKLDNYRENTINIDKLKQAIEGYKNRFTENIEEETYKWKAIRQFQKTFDMEADDFADMFWTATSKAGNLLAGSHYLPRALMREMIEFDQDTCRQMFQNLFDESIPVLKRIGTFKQAADALNGRMQDNKNPHHQTYRSITVYLFFMYPQKYGNFIPQKFEEAANYLEYGDLSQQGTLSRVAEYFRMVDQIWKEVQKDSALIALNKSRLDESCYPDENSHVLAEDMVYYISKHYKELQDEPITPKSNFDYWPSDEEYPMNITSDEWKKYLIEEEMGKHNQIMQMLKGLLEFGGEASCKQLAEEYGGNPSSYVGRAVNLGRRAKKYFNLPPVMDGDQERFFPIPFLGKHSEIDGTGQYVYKLRDELKEALEGMNLTDIDPHNDETPITGENNTCWLYAPGRGASKWDECVAQGVMLLGWPEIGDLSQYNSREEIISIMKDIYGDVSSYWMNSFATWQFSHVIKPGDIIYAKKGRSKIVGRGIVKSEYYYDSERDEFPNVIDVDWTDIGEWPHPGLAQVKTLTEIKIHGEYYTLLEQLFEDGQHGLPEYTDQMFLEDVYTTPEKFEEMKELLQVKKNIILQGAPGVGKTFSAKRLAYAIMGVQDTSRIELIQFHQNYAYEDFIMGYKPDDNGSFSIVEGVFYSFCKEAETDPGNLYFFIIDEINRGNMSKIFGELLMAIENDYRKESIRLAYRDELFSVPENVRLIGMMNTADRSLALIDYALRRRFSFITMEPGFTSEGFKKYQKSLNSDMFNSLVEAVCSLNDYIKKDESLGEGFCIGHSYFCGMKADTCTPSRLRQIVKYDLIPTLEEYWFDDKGKVNIWKQKLQDAVK